MKVRESKCTIRARLLPVANPQSPEAGRDAGATG